MVESYDGSVLRFNISKGEVKNRYMRDSSPPARAADESFPSRYAADVSQETDTRVALLEDRLNVSKQESGQEATVIIKEPVTETKTMEVPLTYEEVAIEKKPVTETRKVSEQVRSEKVITTRGNDIEREEIEDQEKE